MSQKIVLIGAGRIGKVLAEIFARVDFITELWDKDFSKVNSGKSLAEVLTNADFLFICVPTHAVREVLQGIAPYLEKKTIVISLSKGIEAKTQKTVFDLLKELLPKKQKFGLISGPMMAEELEKGFLGAGVFVSRDKKLFSKISRLFEKTNIVLEFSNDITGTILCGVLKNIYSVGLGIVSALELGNNFRGWYVERGIKEMSEIIKIMGGKSESVLTCAGIGDLIATGFSSYSRNFKAGQAIAKKEKSESEGVHSLPTVINLLGVKIKDFVILNALKQIILENADPKSVFNKISP